jgi:hypothetical protein
MTRHILGKMFDEEAAGKDCPSIDFLINLKKSAESGPSGATSVLPTRLCHNWAAHLNQSDIAVEDQHRSGFAFRNPENKEVEFAKSLFANFGSVGNVTVAVSFST